jgi:uncharacterized protein involved in response to NO
MAVSLIVESAVAPVQRRRATEITHARLLARYIGTGLYFMLLPGTFLGVWNLLQVSARHSVGLVSPAWLQAHGHAQVFGWVATFILGIGFYSIPLLNAKARPSLTAARACWWMWTAGVTMRWAANIYGWHWRVLVPLAAVLEIAAFAIFFRAVSQHRSNASQSAGPGPWIVVVIAACIGFALTLIANLLLSVYVAWQGASPEIPHALNERFLAIATWGFLAPFVWGFSSKWLPVLLGLQATRNRGLIAGVIINSTAVLLTLFGWRLLPAMMFAGVAPLIAWSLRLFEPTIQPARTRGVHATFPFFVRFAYAWLIVAALLGVAAALWDVSGGVWGASRHAFTVGFVSVMVFSIGQRVLPAFAAMAPLWSPRLMFAGLLLLTAGCALRVTSEIAAYQYAAAWAWAALPASALIEMTAVTLFAINMSATFVFAPPLLAAPASMSSPPIAAFDERARFANAAGRPEPRLAPCPPQQQRSGGEVQQR